MQCQVDLIVTLAVIHLTLTDIKCVALSLVSARSTSSPVKLAPSVQAVYLLQFSLTCLSCVSLCIWMKSDFLRRLVKGFCYSNLRWKMQQRIFVPMHFKIIFAIQTWIFLKCSVSFHSALLLHSPDASSFAIIKANTQASNSFNPQRNLLQRRYWCRLRCFDLRIRITSWYKRFLGMEVYSSTHSSLMPPTSESDSPSFTASTSDATSLLNEKVCVLWARVGSATFRLLSCKQYDGKGTRTCTPPRVLKSQNEEIINSSALRNAGSVAFFLTN